VEGALERCKKVPFAGRAPESRINPRDYLPGAKSVIAAIAPYAPTILPEAEKGGIVSSMASGMDYHKRIKNLLEEFLQSLSKLASFNWRIFVDSSALLEKEWCIKSGLAFWGKNCLAISPIKGSCFNIGLMVVDIEIKPPASSAFGSCGECRACIDACPAKAISDGGYHLDHSKCLSYLTQKAALSPNEAQMLKGRLFGCDTCQSVCPFNRREESWGAKPSTVDLKWVLGLDEDEWKSTFGKTCAGWKKLGVLKRNAQLALQRPRGGAQAQSSFKDE
jgi:epoxyqueuosine reductase